MNYIQTKEAKQPEHFAIAEKMSSEICSYNPTEQNEMVNLIFAQVLQRREEQIKEAFEKLEHLKTSIQPLTR